MSNPWTPPELRLKTNSHKDVQGRDCPRNAEPLLNVLSHPDVHVSGLGPLSHVMDTSLTLTGSRPEAPARTTGVTGGVLLVETQLQVLLVETQLQAPVGWAGR